MKTVITLLLLIFTVVTTNAQDYFPNKEQFNGKYYSLNPIKVKARGVGKIDQMTCQVGKMGQSRILAMAISDRMMPAVYSFKPASAKAIKRAVFYNKTGVMVIAYDKESFVVVGATTKNPTIDFYSKNKATVTAMTKEKALAYAMKYAEQI